MKSAAVVVSVSVGMKTAALCGVLETVLEKPAPLFTVQYPSVYDVYLDRGLGQNCSVTVLELKSRKGTELILTCKIK